MLSSHHRRLSSVTFILKKIDSALNRAELQGDGKKQEYRMTGANTVWVESYSATGFRGADNIDMNVHCWLVCGQAPIRDGRTGGKRGRLFITRLNFGRMK